MESFGWILLNSKFICVISIVPTYLGEWGEWVNFGNTIAEIQQKYEREREKVGERENAWILIMWLPKFLLPKCVCCVLEVGCAKKKKKTNCGNTIAEIGEGKKKVVTESWWGI